MLLHFIMFTGIMGWQGGQQRERERGKERLSCNYRLAKFDPHNKQKLCFYLYFSQLNFKLSFCLVNTKSLNTVKPSR